MAVRFNLFELLSRVHGKRVGVISTPAGWLPGNGDFASYMTGCAGVAGFFALEHGLRGELQDGVTFDSYEDPRTGLPVFSYYGGVHTFPDEFLDALDVVVFHVQDVSHRAYTYKQTLAETLVAADRTDTSVLILDRPTPLGHLGAYGPLAPQFFPLPLPVGIPVTLGEMALWLTAEKGLSVDVYTIPVGRWQRGDAWQATGLPWIPPSPNIPTLESAYAYACTGIVQATNVSEGRGTCRPFEYVGAPFVDAQKLTARLNAQRLPGVAFRELYFEPKFSKYAGEVCAGVHLMFLQPEAIDLFRTMMTVLQELARLHPDQFELKRGFPAWLDREEWDSGRLAELDLEAYAEDTSAAASSFMQAVEPHLLYG